MIYSAGKTLRIGMVFIGMLLGTHLLLKDSQQKQMDDHLVWFEATKVESKLIIDFVSSHIFPRIYLHKQMERSLFGKSLVFVAYKYEWSIVDNDICSGKSSQCVMKTKFL